MHCILHDWPDELCRKILQNLKAAMRPEYSKILINEAVIPDRYCPSWAAAADINMMSILAAMERTRDQWIRLVQSVGLEVVSIQVSPFPQDVEGIIEAVLPLQ